MLMRASGNRKQYFVLSFAAVVLYTVHLFLVSLSEVEEPPLQSPRRTPSPPDDSNESDDDGAPVPTVSQETAHCYYVQAHDCSQIGWALSPNRGMHVGDEDHIQVRALQPGLWGKGTLSFVLCEGDAEDKVSARRRFVVHDGCDVRLEDEQDSLQYRQQASFNKHPGRYFSGFVSLEAATFQGHFIVQKGGILRLEPEDSYIKFRLQASWLFATEKAADDESLQAGVHLLKQPVPAGTEVPNVIEDTTTCAREHHGCCDITESSFETPQTIVRGPADPSTSEVAAIILSSKRTIAKRRSLLDRWLLDPIQAGQTAPWSRAVISLDCFTHAIDTTLVMTDWVIGPLGDGPKGVPMITVRVPVVTHWTFDRYPDSPWFLTIDDDTLVFSENVMWALSYLDQPYSKLWYVGHSTEWKIKVFFHGKMAFGGGGILISKFGRDLWMKYWQGGTLNASRTWLMSGVCSHDGGDGTVCRCLQVAAGVRDMFTDFRGFHQFDIVGTKDMLKVIKDTCPSCPSVYEQTGLWLDDVVSQHTLCTFHHLLAVENGAVFPGANGSTTGLLFYDAYGAYPHHLLMKRACGYSRNGTYTLCINFGHQLQIFKNSILPDDAFVLLDVKDGTGKVRPTENLIYLAIREHVQEAQICSMHYQFGGTPKTTVYLGSTTTPRAQHDPPCEGKAKVAVKDMFLTADIQMGGHYILWEQQLEHHTHMVDDTGSG